MELEKALDHRTTSLLLESEKTSFNPKPFEK
jgi:hypothetical protein